MWLLNVQYSVKIRLLWIPAKETVQRSIKHIETCESRNALYYISARAFGCLRPHGGTGFRFNLIIKIDYAQSPFDCISYCANEVLCQ